MLSVVFIIFFIAYNSLMIYTKHNRYIEVPSLLGLNLDEAIITLERNNLRYEVLDSSNTYCIYVYGDFDYNQELNILDIIQLVTFILNK